MARKISLVGRAGVGKTSIIKLIFEGEKPKNLMIYPLEPTRGINSRIYSWMDLELGIFDTSGQELPFLLEDQNEQIITFGNTDAIVYIFDYPTWTKKSNEIIEEIHKIFNILKEKSVNSKLILVFHKIDLIYQKTCYSYQLIKSGIKNRINLPDNVPIYLTSLYPNIVFTTFNAFTDILSSLSTDSTNLKEITDNFTKDFPKTICFITNQNYNIISQSITSDFNTDLIFHLYHLTSNYIKIAEQVLVMGSNFHLIDSRSSILGLIIENIEDISPNLKNLIIFSETIDKNELSKLMEIIKTKIREYFNKNN